MENFQNRIVFTNFKGGTAKTTSCRELAFFLSEKGYLVLLLDCDSQGNLSKSILSEPAESGLFEVLEGGIVAPIQVRENLFLLAGDFRLSALDKRLVGELDAYTRLKDLLDQELYQAFDFILFDTAPSLNMLTTNALVAASSIIIPINTTQYSMQGANDLLQAVAKIKKGFNPQLSILGVIISCFDKVPVIYREIREEILQSFGDRVFSTVISKSIRFEEAVAVRTGVILREGKENGRVKAEIEALGEELLSRLSLSAK